MKVARFGVKVPSLSQRVLTRRKTSPPYRHWWIAHYWDYRSPELSLIGRLFVVLERPECRVGSSAQVLHVDGCRSWDSAGVPVHQEMFCAFELAALRLYDRRCVEA